jgi:hypothetical protein
MVTVVTEVDEALADDDAPLALALEPELALELDELDELQAASASAAAATAAVQAAARANGRLRNLLRVPGLSITIVLL